MEERISREKNFSRTSLAIQWLRLPMQGGWVWSLVGNYDPTCLVAKKQTNKQNVKNRNNIGTSSEKTFKMVHIKKNLKNFFF